MNGKRLLVTAGGIALALSILVVTLAACSGATVSAAAPTTANTRVSPTWVTPDVSGTTVSLAEDVVKSKVNVDFQLPTDKGTTYFMAYEYGGKTYVRADVCVPCRSVSFTLYKGTLVCDTCGTVFKASDGTGVSGGCVGYPKASVPYQTVDGKIVMTQADLITAFENTLQPGLP